MAGKNASAIPERKDVPLEYTWKLDKLFPDDASWEEGLQQFNSLIERIGSFKGTLGQSAARLRECLDFMNELELLDERLGYYAMLRYSEDAGSSKNQERYGKYMAIATKAQAAASYQTPEIQSIPDDVMAGFLKSRELEPFLIPVRKILRFKPHVLSENEERLLALQAEANQTARKAFEALTDVDMDFGEVDTREGPRPLTQSTWSAFMISPDRNLREKVYSQFYAVFENHQNTLAALYAGNVQLDKYQAGIRNYESSRAAALFPDDVPPEVYDNLVATVSKNLVLLHDYYEAKRGALKLDRL
ncbi:MAG: oligoendopeptidase F, partial [Spirochaetales bacterium]|nr:oligoendopeptidase F [Spirochaetales bacterium]